MKQIATVKSVSGQTAMVTVKRADACSGCHTGACFGCNRMVSAVAQNPLDAKPGDVVDVESSDRRILGYAFLVFLLPILLAFAAYALATKLSTLSFLPYICAFSTLAISFVILCMTQNRIAGKQPALVICRILPPVQNQESGEFHE